MDNEYRPVPPYKRVGDRLVDSRGRMLGILETTQHVTVARVLAYPLDAYDRNHELSDGWQEGVGYRVMAILDEEQLELNVQPTAVVTELLLQGMGYDVMFRSLEEGSDGW